MTLLQTLQAQVAALQAQIAILQSSPSDTYNLGTVVVFSSANAKWYYWKVAEETWESAQGVQKPLNEWILDAKLSPVGYFEVYVLTVAPSPIYASA